MVWQRTHEAQRTVAMRVSAQAMGFTFAEQVPEPPGASLPLFQCGHGRRTRNVMSGTTAGRPVHVLDYAYVTGGGKSQHVWQQTVALFEGVQGLPEFELAPENILHKIGELFGYQDIDFDAAPEFSRHYLLRGPNEPAIRAAFSADALALLGQEPGWSVQARDGWLAVYRHGRRCPPTDVPALLADCLRVAGAFGRS